MSRLFERIYKNVIFGTWRPFKGRIHCYTVDVTTESDVKTKQGNARRLEACDGYLKWDKIGSLHTPYKNRR